MQRASAIFISLSLGALGFGALALGGAGCATGATIDGSGGSGSGGANASSGSKSTSSKGSMSTSTQSSMSTSTDSSMTSASNMSSTSADPNCPEQPCKLIAPQCGCTPERQCSIGGTGERECILKGTAAIGASCGAEECVPGAMCLGPSANALSCLEFCDGDEDCTGPGGICFFTIDDGNGGSVPDAKLCTPNCDPSTNTGCAAGLGCQAGTSMTMVNFTLCAQAGAGGDGASCATNGSADCAPTFGCFTLGTNDICLKWCKNIGGSCGGGLTCQSLSEPLVIGTTEYGVCNN